MHIFKRVVIGISGGVDSAVAALILKRKGFNVHGVFMQNWDIADEQGYCSANEDYKDAQLVADKLNIKLTHVSYVKEYWNEVFTQMVKEYETGYTPNPDILCNRKIKFNYFFKYAIENLGADAIATGHYARSSFGIFLENYKENENVRLLLPKDSWKDQTFFLSQVKQEALRKTMFPVGDLLKSEVKKIAAENNLEKIAKKKESMGICFIGTRNFQDFIEEYVEDKSGDLIDVDTGKVVGKHDGIHKWTLGQRTRISGLSQAFFTARKDTENNIIYVAQGSKHPLLHSHLLFTEKPHWIHSIPHDLKDGNVLEAVFKFQHSDIGINCKVVQTDKGLVIKLNNYERAITPGQYAVLTKDDECLGSAKIVNTGVSNFALYYLQNWKLRNITGVLEKYGKTTKIKKGVRKYKIKSFSS